MSSLVQMIQFPDKESDLVRSQKLRALALTVSQLAQQANANHGIATAAVKAVASAPVLVLPSKPTSTGGPAPVVKPIAGSPGLPNSITLSVTEPLGLDGGNISFNAALVMLEQLGDVLVSGALAGQILSWNGADWFNVSLADLVVLWSQIEGTPTTLAGYHITDAVPDTFEIIAGPGLTGGGPLSGGSVTIGLAPGPEPSPVPFFFPEDPEDAYVIPGPTGLQGTPGVAGIQGAPGAAGEDGEDALTIPGPAGAAGATGPPGPAGAGITVYFPQDDPEDFYVIPGTQGPTGSPGPTGATGPMGQAIPGRRGEDGEAGRMGPQGAKGATGTTGATGATGKIGLSMPGRRGDDGETGARGRAGLPGPTGSTGATGSTGQTGYGAPGRQGDEGDRGPRGIVGQTGPTGAPGTSIRGQQGDEGARGSAGIPGTPGVVGATGPTGPTGGKGPSGQSIRGRQA